LENNFLPLHSFVLDRSRSQLPMPWFDERLSRLEDYDFLLRLAATAPYDLSMLDAYVCEYRLVARHTQSSEGVDADFAPTNVNPLSNRDSANLAAWAQAKRHIEDLKQSLGSALLAQAAKQPPPVPSTSTPSTNPLAFARATRIAVDQAGGLWAFSRRLVQLARDIGVSGVLRRAQQVVRRL
jgi:hypothetical protein